MIRLVIPFALAFNAAAQIKAPATYDGVIPNGLRITVAFEADGSYVLRETVLTSTPFSSRAERGTWKVDPGAKLALTSGSRLRTFVVRSARSIRPEGEASSDLWLSGRHEPLNDSVELRGLYTYLADAASFKDCLTGKTYAVAPGGRNVDIERAYRGERRPPGAPVLAVLVGHFSGGTIVADDVVSVQAGSSCDTAGATALEGSWKLTELSGGRAVRPATLVFSGGRATGNSGCNRYGGSYTTGSGGSLRFGALASTKRACAAEEAMRQEAEFFDALGKVTGYQLEGGTLRLLAGSSVVARLAR